MSVSSSYSSGFPAAAVNEGERKGLNWCSGCGWNDATSGAYPDWLEIAFTGAKTITEVDIFTVQDSYSAPVAPTPALTFSAYGITAFQVQTWNGTAWITVPGGAVTGNNHVWSTVSFAGITTTKIRVSIASALAGYSRITEIEAYQAPGTGITAPSPSPTPSGGVWVAPRTDGQDGSGTGLTSQYTTSCPAGPETLNDAPVDGMK